VQFYQSVSAFFLFALFATFSFAPFPSAEEASCFCGKLGMGIATEAVRFIVTTFGE
jgi:hypothetical protein